MSRPLVIRVITGGLGRRHLIDLLTGYEESGFFSFDPFAESANRAADENTRLDFQPSETFVDGVLSGRPILQHSIRLQTLAIAPRFEIFPGVEDGAFLGDDVGALIGTAFVVSGCIFRTLAAAYDRLQIDTAPLAAFLHQHQGLSAAIVQE